MAGTPERSWWYDWLQRCRESRRLVLVIVAIALVLDNMLLTTVGKYLTILFLATKFCLCLKRKKSKSWKKKKRLNKRNFRWTWFRFSFFFSEYTFTCKLSGKSLKSKVNKLMRLGKWSIILKLLSKHWLDYFEDTLNSSTQLMFNSLRTLDFHTTLVYFSKPPLYSGSSKKKRCSFKFRPKKLAIDHSFFRYFDLALEEIFPIVTKKIEIRIAKTAEIL